MKRNIKNSFVLVVVFAFLFLMSLIVTASNDFEVDCYDNWDSIVYNEDKYESVFYDPLYDTNVSQEVFNAEENFQNDILTQNGIATFNFLDRDEETDMTIELEGITINLNDTTINPEADSGDFTNVVFKEDSNDLNRTLLKNYIGSSFPEYPLHDLGLTMQGACNDGEYLYYSFKIEYSNQIVGTCFLTGKFENILDENNCATEKFVVKKIRCSNEFVGHGDFNNKADFRHANALAYNSLRDEIVVACCSDDYDNCVFVLDASYLRGNSDIIPDVLKHNVSCLFSNITYNERHNKYIVGIKGRVGCYAFLDSNFYLVGLIEEYERSSEDNSLISRQGLCCDDNYIYAVFSVDDTKDTSEEIQNILIIFDWSGNVCKEINLSINRNIVAGKRISYEIENITIINDKVLLGFNVLYRLSPTENRKTHYYMCDISSEFFNITYIPNESINDVTYDRTNNVLHGLSTKTLENLFAKEGYCFDGWYVYCVETNKWRYKNSDTNTYQWRKEGEEDIGFEKAVYKENSNVSVTVSKGNHVVFCAKWRPANNKFYISFEPNKGNGIISGTMPDDFSVTYGQSTPLPENSFIKMARVKKSNNKDDDIMVTSTFVGWNAYAVETGKWYYENIDTGDKGWYYEGEQPKRYIKYIYDNEQSVKQTTKAGKHIKMVAQWDEFIVYFDDGDSQLARTHIKTPQIITRGVTNYIEKYSTNQENNIGYYQYRIEKNLWRCENEGDAFWSQEENGNLYSFNGSFITQTGGVGEHILFIANW